ncbi:PEP-CTERM sorting domain-containing protein [Pseudodesulfovibrio cashew]|uniref:PEP-CTERM sorting domain-containing protein n=1 Tax=Pseudodesulfovibrio cashew TaxID=2678688 RepID=A0A6I6JDN5_9BACT|nr:PEP-CTERM sorting domain-containing protein [Pseudodesulfovibrio cashew]QGY39190.1 PEP-CTERM sorting domain-containing protein [Pseudodesulfovibrio cashew]
MKKLAFYFILAVALLTVPAAAQAEVIDDWSLNLTTLQDQIDGLYGVGNVIVSDIDNITYMTAQTTNTTIYQDLNAALQPYEGASFTVDSLLETVAIHTTSSSIPSNESTYPFETNYMLWYEGTGLSGYITNVAFDGTNYTFDYVYTSGSITLYWGDPTSSEYFEIAELSLVDGAGAAITDNNGGFNNSGGTDLTAQFTSNPLGTLIDFDPTLFGMEGVYPNLDTFLVFDFASNLVNGSATIIDGQLVASIESSATITLVATPEPSTFLILGLGLLGLVGFRKKFTA